MNKENSSGPRRPHWARRVGAVVVALTRSRYALRRAARRAGDRQMSQRLRRLANRRRAAAADLARDNPPIATQAEEDTTEPIPLLADEIRTATEIGSLAACLRSNRKLRATLERALEANPPLRIQRKLEVLRDDTDRESATLNSRLRELANPVFPESSTPGGTVQS